MYYTDEECQNGGEMDWQLVFIILKYVLKFEYNIIKMLFYVY